MFKAIKEVGKTIKDGYQYAFGQWTLTMSTPEAANRAIASVPPEVIADFVARANKAMAAYSTGHEVEVVYQPELPFDQAAGQTSLQEV